MKTFYAIRIRCQGWFGDLSIRDWLHENDGGAFPYESFEEAEAAIPQEMQDALSYVTEDEEEPIEYETVQDYSKEEGGGFWFKTTDGDEGRVMVVSVSVGKD